MRTVSNALPFLRKIAMEMKRPEICDAIRNKQRIRFIYHGKVRKGEPQCYGLSKKGNEALRVRLIEGGSRPEQMFILDEAESFEILDEKFTTPGPNFNAGDKAMIHIFCELKLD
jgi:hypothetical protein